jgi:hypothetical protein
MKRVLAVVVCLIVTAAACGGDDGDDVTAAESGGGDPEAFCDRLQELDEADDLNLDDEAALDALEELADLAPEEIDGQLNRIARAFEELAELDEDDPEAFGAAFEIFLDPTMARALEDFSAYAEDECGVEVEGADALDDLSSDLTGDLSGDLTDEFSNDFSDDFSEDASDEAPSADDLRTWFEENYADEEYSQAVGGISSASGSATSVDITLSLDLPVDQDTAVAICEAAVEWAGTTDLEEMTLDIEDADQTLVVSGDLEGGCEAA